MHRTDYYGLLTDKGDKITLQELQRLDTELDKMYTRKNSSKQQHLYNQNVDKKKQVEQFVNQTRSGQLQKSVQHNIRNSLIVHNDIAKYSVKQKQKLFVSEDIPDYISLDKTTQKELTHINQNILQVQQLIENRDTQIYHLTNMIKCLIEHQK
ncbi:hypothetical protein SS50377_21074 [Spironucleus salmonicida]|uniref:Uncharacterized protein n=1 Tax=Spironucleus salmonicida TaxID=348837 RepID=V6LH28_9EUKA|nr:hypothetical protein SS50377_28749 [Spironucleus salmonicida]KAH0577720.1 hypothetical protein SS50377_21074 [Spironucleus salmonicida]|eukprot:EST43860.1 Hypothetical protein SS50377_16160 [Spironucleus salmonicida]